MSHNEKNRGCLRTAFSRTHKSSVLLAAGSSSGDGDNETPVMFFADRDTDTSDDSNDDGTIEKESPEEKIANEKKIAEEKAEKERLAEEARLAEKAEKERMEKERVAERQKAEEALRLATEEQRKMQLQGLKKSVGNVKESVENVIKPLGKIQDGVPVERIKGAAIAATAIALLATKGVVASGAIGLSAAYISMSKSVAGDFLRSVGGMTWDATTSASKLTDKLSIMPTFGEVDRKVVNKYRRRPTVGGSDVDEGELAFIEAGDDDDLARVLKEAESVIGEADASIAKAEADKQKEKVKQSIEEELKKIAEDAESKEQERLVGEAKLEAQEEAKLAEEARIAESAKLKAEEEEEEAKLAEEARVAESARLQAEEAIVAEEARVAESARLQAEEARIAEEARVAESARLKAEEARVAEEVRIAESARLKAEEEEEAKVEDEELDEDSDILFDDDQFLAAVELAQEGIEGKIVGVDDIITDNSAKAEWDAAGVLANELRQDVDASSETGVDDEEDDYDFGDIDLEALGRAAREAVEAFETIAEQADEAVLDKKEEWADSMIEDDDEENEDDDFDFEDDEDLFSANNLDEIARAARAAVDAVSNSAIDIDSPPSGVSIGEFASKDWTSLKVAELRDELKKRGLKTSGKKADLVYLLEESDLEISDPKDEDEDESSTILDGVDDEIIELEDFDIEELGRQARAAVEMFKTAGGDFDEEPTEEMLAELESEMAINGEFLEEPKARIEISEMTVAQLKEECRSRGLKVGGKKSALIERLENSTD